MRLDMVILWYENDVERKSIVHGWIPLTRASDTELLFFRNKLSNKQLMYWWLRRHDAHVES